MRQGEGGSKTWRRVPCDEGEGAAKVCRINGTGGRMLGLERAAEIDRDGGESYWIVEEVPSDQHEGNVLEFAIGEALCRTEPGPKQWCGLLDAIDEEAEPQAISAKDAQGLLAEAGRMRMSAKLGMMREV